jgi:hypothetical protein
VVRQFTKVITIGAFGLALSTTSIVTRAEAQALTKEQFDAGMAKLTTDIKSIVQGNNKDLAEAIAAAIKAQHLGPEPHPTRVPTQVVVVQKPVSHRPHWCCRPPPPPCPPWGWGGRW